MEWQPVPFETNYDASGQTVRGVWWRGGPAWVLLLHDLHDECDADSWGTMPLHFVRAGFSTVALDLPGYGLSDGNQRIEEAIAATSAVINRARAEGCTRLFIITVGISLSIIEQTGGAISPDALVAVSPIAGRDENRRPLGRYPKLAIGSSAFDDDADELKQFLRRNSGWTLTSSFAIPARGHDLLTGPLAGKIGNQIVTFLRPYQHVAGPHAPRHRPPPAIPGRGRA